MDLRVPDHWREELEPHHVREIRPGISFTVMRLADGGDPGWMQPTPDYDARTELAGRALDLAAVIRGWADSPVTGLPFHIDFEVRRGAADISPWMFAGITLDGDNLRLWFSTEGWFRVSGGTLKFDTDIVSLAFSRSLAGGRFAPNDDLLTDPFGFAGAS
jgi:hypothetical protein